LGYPFGDCWGGRDGCRSLVSRSPHCCAQWCLTPNVRFEHGAFLKLGPADSKEDHAELASLPVGDRAVRLQCRRHASWVVFTKNASSRSSPEARYAKSVPTPSSHSFCVARSVSSRFAPSGIPTMRKPILNWAYGRDRQKRPRHSPNGVSRAMEPAASTEERDVLTANRKSSR
jgi:hypothetical protein